MSAESMQGRVRVAALAVGDRCQCNFEIGEGVHAINFAIFDQRGDA
jgi:hypothetical protein